MPVRSSIVLGASVAKAATRTTILTYLEKRGDYYSKSVVVVPVVWIVPVAVGTAGVVFIIVERAAAKNAGSLGAYPPQ